jgi:hypothetical protein
MCRPSRQRSHGGSQGICQAGCPGHSGHSVSGRSRTALPQARDDEWQAMGQPLRDSGMAIRASGKPAGKPGLQRVPKLLVHPGSQWTDGPGERVRPRSSIALSPREDGKRRNAEDRGKKTRAAEVPLPSSASSQSDVSSSSCAVAIGPTPATQERSGAGLPRPRASAHSSGRRSGREHRQQSPPG